MLKEGNGRPEICAGNLLRTMRYEVPYERIKGLPSDIIDMPVPIAALNFAESATFMLETYEPRLTNDLVAELSSVHGSEAEIAVKIRTMEERS